MLVTLDYLGESVSTTKEATAATREYAQLIETIVASGIERNISLKLTQLGLTSTARPAWTTCAASSNRPARHEFFVRIDMENSPYTELTLDVFETLWRHEFRNIGIALQSSLHRTEQDVRRMNELGARVRLVKGAYKEPASVAYQQKADVDAAFMRLMRLLLDHGVYPAIATHDEEIIAETRSLRRRAEHRQRPVRVPDAVRHPARPAARARRRRLPHARLRPVRQGVVSVLHAPARRAAGERGFRSSRTAWREAAQGSDRSAASGGHSRSRLSSPLLVARLRQCVRASLQRHTSSTIDVFLDAVESGATGTEEH